MREKWKKGINNLSMVFFLTKNSSNRKQSFRLTGINLSLETIFSILSSFPYAKLPIARTKMQALWQRRINFKFLCKIEVLKISKKLIAENGPSKKRWTNNSSEFSENKIWYFVPLYSFPIGNVKFKNDDAISFKSSAKKFYKNLN